MTFPSPSPEFKKAAIDWLLTHGTCEAIDDSTGSALARLSVMGVDYEATEMPTFTVAALDAGDSYHEATMGEAFSCRVMPLGFDPSNFREGHTFHVGKDDLMSLLLTNMIVGVINAAETGDSEWKARASQSAVERWERHRDTENERRRRAEEARAAKAASNQSQADYEKGLL